MDHSHAALDIVNIVSWWRAPRRDHETVADSGPAVHGDRAVAQLAERAVECRADLGVSSAGGMDQDRGVEGSPETLVTESDRAVQKVGRTLSLEPRLAQDTAKGLLAKADLVDGIGDVGDQGPRQLVFGTHTVDWPDFQGFGVGFDEATVAVVSTGIEGSTGRYLPNGGFET